MFQKGQSGNPAGKPKGCKDKRTELQELLRPHAPALLQKAVEIAPEGDAAALKLCLDKLMPNIRPREDPIPLQLASGSLTEKGQSLLEALAPGALTPTEAKELLTALAGWARIVEVDERLRRVEALEATHHEHC